MEPTLVPATLMTSVALDIFKTTKVVTDEGVFDAFVLCVDRLSGWIVAEPGSFVGLTGEWARKENVQKLAHVWDTQCDYIRPGLTINIQLVENHVSTFGDPNVILTSLPSPSKWSG